MVYDLRGHGRSGGARGYLRSYDHFIEDLDLVLTATTDPAQRLFLYGHSMGAQIVTNYLARRDPQVLGAVLSSPWLRLAFTPPLWKLALARATARLWPGFTQNSPQLKTNLSRDQDWIESLSNPLNHRKMSAVMFANLTAGALHASRSGPSLKIPLLLMHGEADPVTSAQATRQFYETIGSPDRTLVLWPEMRHELHNEIGRKAVLERVAEWLDSRVRRASEPEIVTSTS